MAPRWPGCPLLSSSFKEAPALTSAPVMATPGEKGPLPLSEGHIYLPCPGPSRALWTCSAQNHLDTPLTAAGAVWDSRPQTWRASRYAGLPEPGPLSRKPTRPGWGLATCSKAPDQLWGRYIVKGTWGSLHCSWQHTFPGKHFISLSPLFSVFRPNSKGPDTWPSSCPCWLWLRRHDDQ